MLSAQGEGELSEYMNLPSAQPFENHRKEWPLRALEVFGFDFALWMITLTYCAYRMLYMKAPSMVLKFLKP